MTQSESTTVARKNVHFVKCSASEKGGGIYATLASDDSLLSFTDCSFTTSESVSSEGVFVYIACPHGVESASASEWSTLGEYASLRSHTDKYWVEETEGSMVDGGVKHPQNASLLHFIYPLTIDKEATTMYVRQSGVDALTCGWDDLPCLTLPLHSIRREHT